MSRTRYGINSASFQGLLVFFYLPLCKRGIKGGLFEPSHPEALACHGVALCEDGKGDTFYRDDIGFFNIPGFRGSCFGSLPAPSPKFSKYLSTVSLKSSERSIKSKCPAPVKTSISAPGIISASFIELSVDTILS
jgi:hypothetical protein